MKSIVEIDGKLYNVSETGYLLDFSQFDEKWLQHVAQEQDTIITDEHMEFIAYLQDYYRKNNSFPMMRTMFCGAKFKMVRMFEIFPGGVQGGARKIAGLPEPIK